MALAEPIGVKSPIYT